VCYFGVFVSISSLALNLSILLFAAVIVLEYPFFRVSLLARCIVGVVWLYQCTMPLLPWPV
jgi:hypothetical protein